MKVASYGWATAGSFQRLAVKHFTCGNQPGFFLDDFGGAFLGYVQRLAGGGWYASEGRSGWSAVYKTAWGAAAGLRAAVRSKWL